MAKSMYLASQIRRNHFPNHCEAKVPLDAHEVAARLDPETVWIASYPSSKMLDVGRRLLVGGCSVLPLFRVCLPGFAAAMMARALDSQNDQFEEKARQIGTDPFGRRFGQDYVQVGRPGQF